MEPELKTTNLDVKVLGFGPVLDLTEQGYGRIMPQDVIRAAAEVTFKGKSAEEILISTFRKYQEKYPGQEGQWKEKWQRDLVKAIIENAGRGHASMTTTAGYWVMFVGATKFVDSLFTGAIFSSSLMPSGRRVPITLDSIVCPPEIIDPEQYVEKRAVVIPEEINQEDMKDLYYQDSRARVQYYLDLIERGFPKEDAAKITSYGLVGGGIAFFPLETQLAFKKTQESEGKYAPKELGDFVAKIEDQLKDMGMDVLYWARNSAPRTFYPYPHLFKDPGRRTIVTDMIEKHGIPEKPIVSRKHLDWSSAFESRTNALNYLIEEILQDPESVKRRYSELLLQKARLIEDFNPAVLHSSFGAKSWRVEGEDKRHRTASLTVESIYKARERASNYFQRNRKKIEEGEISQSMIEEIAGIFIIPSSILKDQEETKRWLLHASNSFEVQDKMLAAGIPERAVIAATPRGVEVAVYNEYNLYNTIEGKIPLRLCSTAEREMREKTEYEAAAIRALVPEPLARLIRPKCGTVGFCFERTHCANIGKYVGFPYTKEIHQQIHSDRRTKILSQIGLPPDYLQGD